MESESRSALLAVAVPLIAFKVWFAILLLSYAPTREGVMWIAATHCPLVIIIALLLAGPGLATYRLLRVRARREKLRRAEWMLSPVAHGTVAAAEPALDRSTWPWRNLFRPSDPIGGAVFYLYEISTIDHGDVDWQLMDPAVNPPEGDRAWPRAYGHSDYFRDPAFDAALSSLEQLDTATVRRPGTASSATTKPPGPDQVVGDVDPPHHPD